MKEKKLKLTIFSQKNRKGKGMPTIFSQKNRKGKGMPTIFSQKNRRGSMTTDILPWMIIAVVILVILMITIFVLSGKGVEFIEKIKNIFRGR